MKDNNIPTDALESGKRKVLLVDDDPDLVDTVHRALQEDGRFEVRIASNGFDAGMMVKEYRPDLIILDVMLPGIDGLEIARRVQAGGGVPVLMLSARDQIEDRVAGLEAGADDYLVKPFAFAELLARLRALMRRGPVERPPVLAVGDLRLNPATHQVWRGDQQIELSLKEFSLLETLMRQPGESLSREQLLEHVWDDRYAGRSNVIEVYIRYLREKIDRPFGLRSIDTVRGVGYRMRLNGGR
jgi:two-component system, OmpR family, response regulator